MVLIKGEVIANNMDYNIEIQAENPEDFIACYKSIDLFLKSRGIK